MNWKLASCLIVLGLLTGWFLLFGSDGRVGGGERGGTPAPAAGSAQDLVEPRSELKEPAQDASGEIDLWPEPARAEVATDSPAGGRADLASLAGRVVESDGRPVGGMRVVLLEYQSDLLFDGSTLGEGEPSLELDQTVTAADGRFQLSGAHARAFHGLGLDLGGPRATLRVIDQALEHRARTDIGDVVLAPFGVLTGRVVDEHGAPLAGARIRCGPFPEEILRGHPELIRSDSAVAVSLLAVGGEGQRILEFPAWISAWIERLPVPTVESQADGRFRLEGVALAQVIGIADLRGRVGASFGPVDLSGGTHDLGNLVLEAGRTVRGVVEESSGDPVVGAEVLAGAELVPGIVALLQPCGPSDEEGRFELAGVPLSGAIVAAARRSRYEPWRSVTGGRHEGILIELEPTVALVVNVRDEAGAALSGADLRLEPILTTKPLGGFGDVLAFLPRPARPRLEVREVEPGRYRVPEIGLGTYEVTARLPGRSPGVAEVECVASENEVTLTCAQGARLEVQVVSAEARLPIRGAEVGVLRSGRAGLQKLAAGQTDAEGRAWLGPLPEIEPAGDGEDPFRDQALIRVQHPRFGEYSAALDPRVSPLVITLSPGGSLSGRVHWGGAVPTRLYMLTLEPRGGDGLLEFFHLPRFAVTAPTGHFRVTQLEPGTYGASLFERFLEADPLGQIAAEFEPAELWRGEVTIEEARTAELEIDLTPTGRGITARVAGRVRFDGGPLQGATVEVSGAESVRVTTDAAGRFETPAFVVLERSHVRIEADLSLGSGETQELELYSESFELAQDEVRTIELDLYPHRLRVRVVGAATQAPVSGAEVTAKLKSAESQRRIGLPRRTSDTGEAELIVLEPGEYELSAQAKGFGRGEVTTNVAASGASEPALLCLPQSVPCAGRVDAAPSDVGPLQFSYLQVRSAEGEFRSGARLQGPDYAFSLEGLVPGQYTANFFLGGQSGQEVKFELGPAGDSDLVLAFTPRTE